MTNPNLQPTVPIGFRKFNPSSGILNSVIWSYSGEGDFTSTWTYNYVPEPGRLSLLSAGIALLVGLRPVARPRRSAAQRNAIIQPAWLRSRRTPSGSP